jgi:putative alpha-1,2-mannosidase
MLNGKPYSLPYIEHAYIAAGGTLTFEMGDTPVATEN